MLLLKVRIASLVIVSDPSLATKIIHTQAWEFRSRPKNSALNTLAGNGERSVGWRLINPKWRKEPKELRPRTTLEFEARGMGQL